MHGCLSLPLADINNVGPYKLMPVSPFQQLISGLLMQHLQAGESAIASPYGSFTFSLEIRCFEHVALSSMWWGLLKTVPGKWLSGFWKRQMLPCSSAPAASSWAALKLSAGFCDLICPTLSVYMFMLLDDWYVRALQICSWQRWVELIHSV